MTDRASPGAGTEWWYLSCRRFTVAVCVRDGIVVAGPPIVRRFRGRPAKDLGTWARRLGDFRCSRLPDVEASIVEGLTELADDTSGRK